MLKKIIITFSKIFCFVNVNLKVNDHVNNKQILQANLKKCWPK